MVGPSTAKAINTLLGSNLIPDTQFRPDGQKTQHTTFNLDNPDCTTA